MLVNYYYDWTPDHSLSNDTEGNLVQLCQECAVKHRKDVQLAARGDDVSICELCDASQEDAE